MDLKSLRNTKTLIFQREEVPVARSRSDLVLVSMIK